MIDVGLGSVYGEFGLYSLSLPHRFANASVAMTLITSINVVHNNTSQLLQRRKENRYHAIKPLRKKKAFLQKSFGENKEWPSRRR